MLIELGADPSAVMMNGWTPLLLASQRGHVGPARFLIESGADVNVRVVGGRTPLYFAVSSGRLEIAKLLIEAGAEVDLCARASQTSPLHVAAGARSTALVSELLAAGARRDLRDWFGRTAEDIAIAVRCQEVLALLNADAQISGDSVGPNCRNCGCPTRLNMSGPYDCGICRAAAPELHFACPGCDFDLCGNCAPVPT